LNFMVFTVTPRHFAPMSVLFGLLLLWPIAATPQTPAHGIREFTASATFEVPAGISHITVELWGAGGGGGAGALTGPAAPPGAGGGGGGSGAYLRASMSVVPNSTYSIELGRAGEGTGRSKKTSASGSNGGDTIVRRGATVLLTAMGGRGGRSASVFKEGAPGAGGDAMLVPWILQRDGFSGYPGQAPSSSSESSFTPGGSGGAAIIGTIAPIGAFGGAGGSGGVVSDGRDKGSDGGAGFAIITW
jgi:hypothetical protein